MKSFLYCLGIFLFVSCQGEVRDDSKTDGLDEVKETEVVSEKLDIAETYLPMDMGLRGLQSDDLPDCDYDGNIHDCWGWDDKNGENFLIRTLEEAVLQESLDDGTESYGQTLHVYHYVSTLGGGCSLLRDLTDFEKLCDFDLDVSHLESVVLSDLNEDNIGEIIFGYRLACRSDVSPSTQKVVLFEGGEKYILRGFSETIGFGGEYEQGVEFETAPNSYLMAAEDYWEANKVEFE